MRVVDELMNGKQFDGGDAEPGEVLDGGGVSQAGVRAPLCVRDLGMGGGEALDVYFVDDRLVQRHVRWPVVAPVEVRVVHH